MIPDFATDTGNDDANTTRDIVVVTSGAGGAFFNQFRHQTFLTDVRDRPGVPGVAARPQVISTAQTPASDGKFSDKRGRFGPHAIDEEFGPPFYQKIVFVSYFNAGVRAFEVRDPYNPEEVASFIPAVTKNTDFRCGMYNGKDADRRRPGARRCSWRTGPSDRIPPDPSFACGPARSAEPVYVARGPVTSGRRTPALLSPSVSVLGTKRG